MKKIYRDKEGKIITIKEWFALNHGSFFTIPDVTYSYKHAETQLGHMLEFEEYSVPRIELALVGATNLILYQEGNPSVEIFKDGTVFFRGAGYSAQDRSYAPKHLQRFQDVLRERIKKQSEIVEKGNKTFLEV